jgi:hypothetical protein
MTHIVLLSCGHWFRERAGEGVRLADGEERACSRHGHQEYRAVYLADVDLSPLGEGWMLL